MQTGRGQRSDLLDRKPKGQEWESPSRWQEQYAGTETSKTFERQEWRGEGGKGGKMKKRIDLPSNIGRKKKPKKGGTNMRNIQNRGLGGRVPPEKMFVVIQSRLLRNLRKEIRR